ncbi:MAG TPA: glycosyltransferase family 4 protein [Methylomirabilota bacterium]|nr:glycosyltransferase family 4 protein [Methylomirabilota bacterium]
MTADTVGGVWTYAMELCREYGEREIEVILATMGNAASPEQRAEVSYLSNVQLRESQYKLEWMPEPWVDVDAAGEWLLALERETEPDIIHLNGYAHGSLPFHAPVIIVAHSCVCSWWSAVKGEEAPSQWGEYRERVRRGVHGASVVVAPSNAMLDEIERRYGSPRRKAVIYNGRSPDHFRPAHKEPFVLAAGRVWDEAKNIAALARVAPALDCPVFVAGDQTHPTQGTVPLNGVRSLGQLNAAALGQWFSRAAIYALPAKYEPFGLSALEAALSGCALILGDIPSLREIWGNTAWFVPPDDAEALKGAINDLIELPAARETLARKAQARALEFTPARMTRGYLRAYSQLLTDTASPRIAA